MRQKTTRAQRQQLRCLGGPLKTVRDKTRQLYDFSLQLYLVWATMEESWPLSNEELDASCSRFLLHCWQEGETRATVANLLSCIGDREPSLRWHLSGTRRLHRTWIKRELGVRCCALYWSMTEALAGLFLHWGWLHEALMALLMHHCLLRTMEGLNARRGDFMLQGLLMKGHLSLPDTKTSARHGRGESVSITDPQVMQLLLPIAEPLLPGEKLYPHSAAVFRKRLQQAVAALGWEALDVQAYSFRRGGATELFRQTNSMQAVAFRGRWSNFQTAKIYTDSALADRAQMLVPNRQLQEAARMKLRDVLSHMRLTEGRQAIDG